MKFTTGLQQAERAITHALALAAALIVLGACGVPSPGGDDEDSGPAKGAIRLLFTLQVAGVTTRSNVSNDGFFFSYVFPQLYGPSTANPIQTQIYASWTEPNIQNPSYVLSPDGTQKIWISGYYVRSWVLSGLTPGNYTLELLDVNDPVVANLGVSAGAGGSVYGEYDAVGIPTIIFGIDVDPGQDTTVPVNVTFSPLSS